MKQISIVYNNGVPGVAGINDRGESIEPLLTESLQAHIQAISDELDAIKDPEQLLKEQMAEFIEQKADDETALTFLPLWPTFDELIGQPGPVGKLLTDGDTLYRIYQAVDVILDHHRPAIVPAHYVALNKPPEAGEPETYPDWTQKGWEFGAKVWNKDRLWENVLEGMANIWEPGTPGIDERYWIDITEETK